MIGEGQLPLNLSCIWQGQKELTELMGFSNRITSDSAVKASYAYDRLIAKGNYLLRGCTGPSNTNTVHRVSPQHQTHEARAELF